MVAVFTCNLHVCRFNTHRDCCVCINFIIFHTKKMRAAIKAIGCFIPGQSIKDNRVAQEFVRVAKARTLIPPQYLDYMLNSLRFPGEIITNDYWTAQPWFGKMREILPENKRAKADSMFDGIRERRVFPIAPYGVEGMDVYSNCMTRGKSLCEIPDEPRRMLPSDAEALAGALCLHSCGGTQWPEVDSVLSFAMTPEKTMPSSACQVHEKLNIGRGPAFHMDACCATQAYQHSVAAALVMSGMAKNVLCTASFSYWALRDPSDYISCILSDAATAVLIGRDETAGLAGSAARAYGRTNHATWEDYGIANIDKYYGLQGIPKRRIRLSTDSAYQNKFIADMKAAVAEVVPRAMTQAQMQVKDMDFVATHQAVRWSGHQVVRDIGYTGKYFNTFERMGNVAACSPMINAWEALKTQKNLRKMLWVCTGVGSSAIANVEVISSELHESIERDIVKSF
jgi:3-oxoacyl-[acyl-carrier-protein] synthase-3